eukprot:TRINITY_DN30_c0_g1_i1.p1 TRINITY_DN30_c0_g1~~TRINITY_DN30_c0_g1_i1.p1  ORF type:complete len:696 (+),score=159.16 TRINITY_DN30_c0_g1_i1:105-2192(+)
MRRGGGGGGGGGRFGRGHGKFSKAGPPGPGYGHGRVGPGGPGGHGPGGRGPPKPDGAAMKATNQLYEYLRSQKCDLLDCNELRANPKMANCPVEIDFNNTAWLQVFESALRRLTNVTGISLDRNNIRSLAKILRIFQALRVQLNALSVENNRIIEPREWDALKYCDIGARLLFFRAAGNPCFLTDELARESCRSILAHCPKLTFFSFSGAPVENEELKQLRDQVLPVDPALLPAGVHLPAGWAPQSPELEKVKEFLTAFFGAIDAEQFESPTGLLNLYHENAFFSHTFTGSETTQYQRQVKQSQHVITGGAAAGLHKGPVSIVQALKLSTYGGAAVAATRHQLANLGFDITVVHENIVFIAVHGTFRYVLAEDAMRACRELAKQANAAQQASRAVGAPVMVSAADVQTCARQAVDGALAGKVRVHEQGFDRTMLVELGATPKVLNDLLAFRQGTHSMLLPGQKTGALAKADARETVPDANREIPDVPPDAGNIQDPIIPELTKHWQVPLVMFALKILRPDGVPTPTGPTQERAPADVHNALQMAVTVVHGDSPKAPPVELRDVHKVMMALRLLKLCRGSVPEARALLKDTEGHLRTRALGLGMPPHIAGHPHFAWLATAAAFSGSKKDFTDLVRDLGDKHRVSDEKYARDAVLMACGFRTFADEELGKFLAEKPQFRLQSGATRPAPSQGMLTLR